MLGKYKNINLEKCTVLLLFTLAAFATFINTYNDVNLSGKHLLIYYGIYLSVFFLIIDLFLKNNDYKNLIGLLLFIFLTFIYYYYVSNAIVNTLLFFLIVHLFYRATNIFFNDIFGNVVLSLFIFYFLFSLFIYVDFDLKNPLFVNTIYFLSALSLILIKKDVLIKIKKVNLLEIFPFLFLYLFFSSFFYFTWDELNSSFWYPYQSYLNGSFIDPGRPNSILMTSHRAIGQGFFSAITSVGDRLDFTFTMKLITAFLCFFIITLFVNFFFKSKKLKLFFYVILFSLPIFKLQIFANFFDLTSIIYTLTSLYFLRKIYKKKNNNDILLFSLISGLSIYLSLKCIPLALISYSLILFYLYREKNIKLLFICSISFGLFITINFIKAYIYTGNPFFPRLNYIFHSPFYSILKEGVSTGFTLNHHINFFDFFSIFSSNVDHNKQFYYGGIFSTFGFLAAISVSSLFLPHKKIFKNYLLLSILIFIIVTILIGPEHRYLVVVVLPFLFFAYLNLFIYFKNIIIIDNKFIYYFAVMCSLASFNLVNFGVGKFSYNFNEKHFLTNETKKWYSKLDFYNEFNRFSDGSKKILMFYLQDKFFIDNRNVYENDWYDFPVQQDLRKIWLDPKYKTNNEKLFNVGNYLCENDFKYFLWSKNQAFGDELWLSYLKIDIESEYVNSYTIECSNLFDIYKKNKGNNKN